MRPRKALVVASTEFNTVIRTKAFLVSLLLLPAIMFGSILIQKFAADRVDLSPRPFAVLDRSHALYPAIAQAAESYNHSITDSSGQPLAPTFLPQPVEEGDSPLDAFRLELSDRVRKGELYAFVEIPKDIETSENPTSEGLRYYSQNPNDRSLIGWLESTVNNEVRNRRLRAAGIDPGEAERLSLPVSTESLTLVERSKQEGQGAIKDAQRVDPIRTLLVPAALMFVVFIVIMSTTPQLLQSVIEEKMSRISEVLLGSISPFELMMGKLLGNAGIALVLATLYVGGGYAVATYFGYTDSIPPYLLACTALFLVMAVFLFGSLYLAMGSACSELKDAQSLMMPVMLLSMLPLFFWLGVVQAPNSPLSVGLSLFPFSTPYLMLLRMATTPGPPLWQVGLSIVLTALTVIACVWAAGKIFRVGLLMQGKPPSLVQMAKWVLAR